MSDNEQRAEEPRGLRAYARHAQNQAAQPGPGPKDAAQSSVSTPQRTPGIGGQPSQPQSAQPAHTPTGLPGSAPMGRGESTRPVVPPSPIHQAHSVPPPAEQPTQQRPVAQPRVPQQPRAQQAPAEPAAPASAKQEFDPEATLLRPIGYSQIPPTPMRPPAHGSHPGPPPQGAWSAGQPSPAGQAVPPTAGAQDQFNQAGFNQAGQASNPWAPQPVGSAAQAAQTASADAPEAKKPFFVPNGPNILTLLRIVAVPVFAVMLLMHPNDPGWRIATTVVFVLAILTDLVDGWWARKANLITDFGKIADPIADKALTGMAFVGLSILGELSWWVTGIVLLREWGITLLRFVMLKRGVVMAAKRGGKLKTVTQAVALSLFLLPLVTYTWGEIFQPVHIPELISWIVMAIAVTATVFTGIDIVKDAIVGERPKSDDDYY